MVDESGWVIPAKRYKHESIRYYARRLWARVDEQQFNELPPTKSFTEKYVRVKSSIKGLFHSVDHKIGEIADKIDKEAEK